MCVFLFYFANFNEYLVNSTLIAVFVMGFGVLIACLSCAVLPIMQLIQWLLCA